MIIKVTSIKNIMKTHQIPDVPGCLPQRELILLFHKRFQ